jgi:DNA ligase-1
MKWPDDKDPKGYWLSEKLDGVRAWWDGEKMWSRTGRAWNPPQWFLDKLPKDLHLDGELWMQRDSFDETSGICRRTDTDGWKRINFMVFDITNVSLLYEERLKELKRRLPDGEKTPDEVDYYRLGAKICVLPAVQCRGKEHLDQLMSHIMDKGGEGLMLRQAKSAYEFKRSKTLYKLKYWYDAEGLVVGQEWGQGEHKGRMGAVRIEMECGKTITVGSGFSRAQRDSWQPTIGKVIRYRFQELSKDGFPRFPIYEGTAPDKLKARDAIVRSTTFRANARAEDLERALADYGRQSEVVVTQ